MTPLEQARITRDKQLRRSILKMLNESRGRVPINGQMIFEVYGELCPLATKFVDESHAMNLLADLDRAGLVQCISVRTHKAQPDNLEYRNYVITDDGVALLDELIPAHPLVQDDRI